MRIGYALTPWISVLMVCVDMVDLSKSNLNFVKFKSFVKHVMDCRKIVGLGLTLVYDNEVVFTGGFGEANIERHVPVDKNSKFAIGSLTKAFTSAIIAKVLSEQKRYNWDTPIRHIIGGDFKLFDDIRTENVNFRDLLSHKVGVPGYFEPLLVGFPENTTRQEFIRRLQYQPPVAPLRTKFIYSNYFYALAGYAVEKITGKSWEQLVHKYLFNPLKMKNSGFVDQIKSFDDFALGYSYLKEDPVRLKEELLYTSSPSGPAGSIFSTPLDMGNWILFHLNSGTDSNGTHIVNNTALAETYKGQMVTPFFGNRFQPQFPVSDAVISYNMGWLTSVYRGHKRLWHSGGIVGYSSLLWLFPHKNVGMFASMTGSKANSNSDVIKVILSRAADMLLGLDPWLNNTTACSFPEPWYNKSQVQYPKKKALPTAMWNISSKIQDYEGTFCNPAFGAIKIYILDSELFVRYGRFGKMKLYPISETEFDLRYMGSLWFVTNSDNNIKPIRIRFTANLDALFYPIDRTYSNTSFSRSCYDNGTLAQIQGNYRNISSIIIPTSYYLVLLFILYFVVC